MSMLSMVIKIGIVVSNLVVGWGLVAVGFDAANDGDCQDRYYESDGSHADGDYDYRRRYHSVKSAER